MSNTFVENEDGTFELNMTEEEYTALVITYVSNVMRPESLDQFDSVFKATGNVKEALYASVINEVVNAALEKFIDELETKETE